MWRRWRNATIHHEALAPPVLLPPPDRAEAAASRCGIGPPAACLRLLSAPLATLPLPSPPLAAADRRQVTVLSGTLAHATALADRLGLEAFQSLAQMFHTLAQECVQRYEGTVQACGEASVLALFGVPVAQEEHAWCAVQAALELQQRLRVASAGHAGPARRGPHGPGGHPYGVGGRGQPPVTRRCRPWWSAGTPCKGRCVCRGWQLLGPSW